MIRTSEDENDEFIGIPGLTNLGVGCISRAVTVAGARQTHIYTDSDGMFKTLGKRCLR